MGTPISSLPTAGALTGDELIPIVQGGVTKHATVDDLGPAIPYTPAGTGAVATTVQSKLRETVSVKDFGAVGDGVTDDTTKIQAAFSKVKATGGDLIFPPGIYKISGTIGCDTSNASDFCDNVTITGYGATILADGTAALTALRLEGNNCHVRGLKFNSTRSLDHTVDPGPLRTPYQVGIQIGGKLTGDRSVGNATYLCSNVSVQDCEVVNFNLPIVLGRASFGRVEGCTVHDFTDTGILVDDCITDIHIGGNTVYNGADDCIFVRHYDYSFYVNGTTNYVGRINVIGNTLGNTFGKCFGVGGFSDVIFDSNNLFQCWAGSINYENGGNWTSRSIDNQNFTVTNNVIRGSGTYFGPAYWRAAAFPDAGTQSALNGQYQSTRTPYPWKNLTFANNRVIAPRSYGVCIKSADRVTINGNLFLAENAASVCAVKVTATQDVMISDNYIIGNGLNFQQCYEFSVTAGEAILERVKIRGNVENFQTKVFNITSAEYSKIDYLNTAPAGYNGTVASYGFDATINRTSFLGSGPNSNFQVYHATSWPVRVFNSGGDMLLQVNDSGAATGNVGIAVGGTPSRRLHVTGPGGGAPALRLDNSNVNNGTVATTLGSVGPTGSTAGNPQGWLAIDVGGATRYVPFW